MAVEWFVEDGTSDGKLGGKLTLTGTKELEFGDDQNKIHKNSGDEIEITVGGASSVKVSDGLLDLSGMTLVSEIKGKTNIVIKDAADVSVFDISDGLVDLSGMTAFSVIKGRTNIVLKDLSDVPVMDVSDGLVDLSGMTSAQEIRLATNTSIKKDAGNAFRFETNGFISALLGEAVTGDGLTLYEGTGQSMVHLTDAGGIQMTALMLPQFIMHPQGVAGDSGIFWDRGSDICEIGVADSVGGTHKIVKMSNGLIDMSGMNTVDTVLKGKLNIKIKDSSDTTIIDASSALVDLSGMATPSIKFSAQSKIQSSGSNTEIFGGGSDQKITLRTKTLDLTELKGASGFFTHMLFDIYHGGANISYFHGPPGEYQIRVGKQLVPAKGIDAMRLMHDQVKILETSPDADTYCAVISDGTIDTSAMSADTTLKIRNAQSFKVNDGTTDLISVADGNIDISGSTTTSRIKMKAGGAANNFTFQYAGDRFHLYDASSDPIMTVLPSTLQHYQGLMVLGSGSSLVKLERGTGPKLNMYLGNNIRMVLNDSDIDLSGMLGDPTIKFDGAQSFKINDGTNDLLGLRNGTVDFSGPNTTGMQMKYSNNVFVDIAGTSSPEDGFFWTMGASGDASLSWWESGGVPVLDLGNTSSNRTVIAFSSSALTSTRIDVDSNASTMDFLVGPHPDTTPQISLGTSGAALASGATVNEFSIDGTLAGNSDNAVPTEKAVKTYVDNLTHIATQVQALASDPGTPLTGEIWLNTTDKQIKCYNGTSTVILG